MCKRKNVTEIYIFLQKLITYISKIVLYKFCKWNLYSIHCFTGFKNIKDNKNGCSPDDT